MQRIESTDISRKMEFRRVGYDYSNVVFDDGHHCGIWKMTKVIDGKLCDMGYEVVRGKKYRNPDGSVIYRYPSDEDFGILGFYTYDFKRCVEIMEGWLKEDVQE